MNYQTPNVAWVENEPLLQLKRECVCTGFKGVHPERADTKACHCMWPSS